MEKRNRVFSIRFQADTYRKLKKLAAADSRTVSNYISMLLEQEIIRFESQHGPIPLPDGNGSNLC